ncbi:MAG: substrate-binding domain-containing protein [Caldilinea sp.]|nr:substrate-binding domain-containing protein [Caldilinea sp.]MCW5843142.1 substrate-binding domain-containing protein [Caldilinea sp.]
MRRVFSSKGAYIVASLLVIMAMLLSACAPAATPSGGEAAAEPAAEGQTYRIAFSVPAMSFPFFVHMEKQVRDEAAKMGNVEIITLDGQDDTTKQVADLEGVIAQGYDGLIVSPRTSEGVAPVIQQVIDAGIPVVTIDRSAEGVNGLLAHVGANNVIGGEAQGQAILSLFPDGAKIIELLGTPGASPAIDRSAGLHNIIDPAGNIEVVCQQTGEFKRDKGLTVTENCLSSNPDAQAIVAANDDMALGAIEAVKAAGLSIPILGFDALPEAIQAVNEGTLYGSVEQFPGGQSRTALNTIMDFIVDGTAPESDVVLLSPKLVSKDNLMEAERIGEVPGMEAAAAPEAAAPAEQLTIAFSVPAMSFPFFVHMEKQVRDEAAKIGNIEIVTLDGQDDTTKQVADLEGVIAQGYDGLIVSPRTSEGVAPVIQQVIDAGIPVVTIDRSAEGVTGLLAHVGANNVIGGEAQGEAILSLFPDGAKIIELLGTPGASPAIDRSAGLHNVIDPAGNIEVVCQQSGEFKRDKGLTVTENCLSANPDAQAIVAANDDMALGAVEAVKAAGLDIPILGFDALPEALLAVRDGALYGSVEQFPGGQSRTALQTIVNFIVAGTAPESDVVLLSPKLITTENFEEAERIGEIPQ